MPLPEEIDPLGLVASLLAVAIVGYGLVARPEALDLHGPVTFVLLGLMALLVLTLPYRPARETRAWNVLAGATFAALGAHNLAGPESPLLTGYGFLVAGIAAVGYHLVTYVYEDPSA